jgi:hypothetical protein
VIGLLRFVGLMNAAVWFGAAVLITFFAGPAMASAEMQNLTGSKNFEYFSVAISQILSGRYFGVFVGCSFVSLLHLAAEWLYLGKYPRRTWAGLVLGLCLFGVGQDLWLQPKLKQLHREQYTRPQQRESLARSFRVWNGVSRAVNLVLVAGLGAYLWRVANPSDPTRFVSTTKFRS